MALAISAIVSTAGIVPVPQSSRRIAPAATIARRQHSLRIHYPSVRSIFGGHIVTSVRYGAMYDTLVNIQSGPRILDSSFADDRGKSCPCASVRSPLVEQLRIRRRSLNGTFMNVSKGRIYSFQGSFRRDRQYFDYNLLANPLIPPASIPFVPILDTPHLYNTVRRMTDVNLTLAPLRRQRTFWLLPEHQPGANYSTVHVGAEALLLQNWRVSTDVWNAGIDWKPLTHTSVSFDEFITRYKGNTSWQLTGAELRALQRHARQPRSRPLVRLGYAVRCAFQPKWNRQSRPAALFSLTPVLRRRARLFPSEQLHFQSASIPHVTMNGRFMYMGTTSHLDELLRELQRPGLSCQKPGGIGPGICQRAPHQRQRRLRHHLAAHSHHRPVRHLRLLVFPSTRDQHLHTTNYAGTSLLNPPGAATTTTASDYQALNQKTKVNTFLATWDLAPRGPIVGGLSL